MISEVFVSNVQYKEPKVTDVTIFINEKLGWNYLAELEKEINE